jgi:extradiol dioxygenase family protein
MSVCLSVFDPCSSVAKLIASNEHEHSSVSHHRDRSHRYHGRESRTVARFLARCSRVRAFSSSAPDWGSRQRNNRRARRRDLIAVLKGYGHKIELLQYLAPPDRKHVDLRPCDVGSVHVALLVDDLNAVLNTIAASGWKAAGKPQTLKSGPNAGKRVVYVRDPDGTTIEFMQAPKPVDG